MPHVPHLHLYERKKKKEAKSEPPSLYWMTKASNLDLSNSSHLLAGEEIIPLFFLLIVKQEIMSKPGLGRALIGGAAMVAMGWGIMKGEWMLYRERACTITPTNSFLFLLLYLI